MEQLKIHGNLPLKGEVRSTGAKNSVTKLIVASLLSNKKCILHNVPDISEVAITLEFCKEVGMQIQWDKEAKTLELQTPHIRSTYIPQRFSGANRIPILMIGALLARTREDIVVPTMGGCKIGARSIDFHIAALEKLGAVVEYRKMHKDGAYFAQAHEGLKGNHIHLSYPSVGATENAMLAASRAKGKTVIHNAAIEPEVMDLLLFLQKMGVEIYIDTNRTIVLTGTDSFQEVEHHVIPDRIEIASFAMAAIATKGDVFIRGAKQVDLISFLNVLRQIGGGFEVYQDGIRFFYKNPLKSGILVETDVHPGFLTDWQQPLVVLLTQAQGMSVIHETVYENRFGYTHTLNALGANIHLFDECLGPKPCRFHEKNHMHSVCVEGITPLRGGKIEIPDLRAGFAYVLAALIADDITEITNLQYLDRGYEQLETKLALLGANIVKESSLSELLT